MPLKWSKRWPEWKAVLTKERRRLDLGQLMRTVLSGPVPRSVWRHRIRHGCMQCPVYNPTLKQCRSPIKGMEYLGCGCYVPLSAMFAREFRDGCWGKTNLSGIGWPVYYYKNPWHRMKVTVLWLLGR